MVAKKRGRPAFKPTPALRRKVEQCVFGGMSKCDIAAGLGIDENTLRKHFEHELHIGLSRRRIEVLDILFSAARKGNVTAAKKLEEMGARTALAAEFDGADDADPAQPKQQAKTVKPGKKEEAAASARDMLHDEEWGADIAASLGTIRPQ